MAEIDIMQMGDAGEIRRWLLGLCADGGISVTELARRAEVSPSTLTRFLKADPGGPMLSGRTLQKLTTAQQRTGVSPQTAYALSAASRAALNEDRSDYHAPSAQKILLHQMELAPADMIAPEGADDLELMWAEPGSPDRGADPAPGEARARMFAIYMPGEFMRPRLRAGECLLIDRLRPAAIGSEVFVSFVPRTSGERIAAIAELVDRDRSQIRLLQHHGSATVHRRFVQAVYPVVGVFRGDIPGSGLQLDLPPMR